MPVPMVSINPDSDKSPGRTMNPKSSDFDRNPYYIPKLSPVPITPDLVWDAFNPGLVTGAAWTTGGTRRRPYAILTLLNRINQPT